MTGSGDTAERDERLGSEVDKYTITRLIGRGGMGAVYEARHTRLGRRAAIKFLLRDLLDRAELLRRFENEAVAAGGLEHPNLVAVNDLGRAPDGAPYLVMEYLPGEDCARLLRRVGPLPAARAVSLVLQACRGVAVAHDAGIVHRDLKPENLFVIDAGDGTDQIKVLDFGIAKLRPANGEAMTRTGSTFGTTHYMSPEQARGASEVDVRTDVWSLGVVLYELLGGRKPFDAEQPLGVVHQILNAPTPSLEALRPGLPKGLVAAVEKALRKDTAERFPSIRALASALTPFAGRSGALDEPAPALTPTRRTPATVPEPAATRPSRVRLVGTGLAIALVGGIVAMSIVSARRKPATEAAPPPAETAARPVAAPAAPTPRAPEVPVAAPEVAPVAAPGAVAKASGQSGQSEQPVPAPSGAVGRRLRPAPRGKAAAPSGPTAGARPDAPARPSLTLDPNPY